jgi:hypothetical protein
VKKEPVVRDSHERDTAVQWGAIVGYSKKFLKERIFISEIFNEG